MEPHIRLRGLTKQFTTDGSTTTAVAGIDLDIGAGEVVALLGPNGAGKTTTLDMILGFTEPTAGRLEVFGDTPRRAVIDGRISAVLQTGGLIRDLTVGETIELIASTYAGPDPDDVIARTGLAHLLDRKVQACSGGEQQRLRFALALLPEPDLLLLDEPTASLDVDTRSALSYRLAELKAEGVAMIGVLHHPEDVEGLVDDRIQLTNSHAHSLNGSEVTHVA